MRLVGEYDDSRDDDPPVFEGPDEHDRHLMDDDLEETVPCAHCGREIWSYAQQCPHCRTHFRGEAWQFKPAGESPRHGNPITPIAIKTIITILVILAFLWLIIR